MQNTLGILGSTGMLGRTLCQHFSSHQIPIQKIERSSFDFIQGNAQDLIKNYPDALGFINCAAILSEESSRKSPAEVFQVNSIFPRNLALACSKQGKQFIHISTDGIFSGAQGPYLESDPCDTDSLYGMSKFLGESNHAMVLRTSIIGENPHRGTGLLEWVKKNRKQTLSGFTNHFWNGVTTLELSAVLLKIIQKKLFQKGIFHLYSPKRVSKFELLQMINQVYALGIQIDPLAAINPTDRTLTSHSSLSKDLVHRSIEDQIKNLHANSSSKA